MQISHVLDVILDTTPQFLTASFELAFSPIPETIRVYQDPGRVAVEDGRAYIEETNMIQSEADAIPSRALGSRSTLTPLRRSQSIGQ